MHRKGEMYRNVHDELLQRRSFVVELAEFGADTSWSLAVGQKLEKLKKLSSMLEAIGSKTRMETSLCQWFIGSLKHWQRNISPLSCWSSASQTPAATAPPLQAL